MSVSSFIFPISTSSSLPLFLSLSISSAFSLKNSSFSSLLCKQTVITNKTEEHMLWGKRLRPPMKRTTSLNEIIFDLGETPPSYQSDDHQNNHFNGKGVDQSFLSMVSPRNNNNHGRHSADFLETSNFLKACGLCKRKLVPGRDIYMYRGDSAFCSLECRQQQMNQDERKEKCSNASSKKQAATSSSTTGSQVSAKGGTVATV